MPIYESHLEEAALDWFAEPGYQKISGYEIAPAPDGVTPERDDYRQVILFDRLRAQLAVINPEIPAAAIEDAIQQIANPNLPALIQANRQFHRWLCDGVPVQFQRGGETVGDRVQLLDFARPDNNDWAAINQFTVRGPHHTRRPDIIVFINGLPLAVLELKNPADEQADLWKAFDQLQTYKEQIPDLFISNELLVISDGITARVGSLTAETRVQLRELLAGRPSGGIIFTTIQKFSPFEEEDKIPLLSPRRNIIVVCDEAQRTQFERQRRFITKAAWPDSTSAKRKRQRWMPKSKKPQCVNSAMKRCAGLPLN